MTDRASGRFPLESARALFNTIYNPLRHSCAGAHFIRFVISFVALAMSAGEATRSKRIRIREYERESAAAAAALTVASVEMDLI